LLTSSFTGTLALAFLRAESGRKVGQNACGVRGREGERERDRETERIEEPRVEEQTPHTAVTAIAKYVIP
jgi:hypothetical protein